MPESTAKDLAPWNELVPGGLYILLFVRSDPPRPNDFHWALYLHQKKEDGYKYHIKTIGDGWIADHGTENGVFKAFLLVGLFHIATTSLEQSNLDLIDGVMRTYDSSLNTSPITCRTWVLRILKLLKDGQVLKCNDLDALQMEAFEFGNEYAEDAAQAKQPRPVGYSNICGSIQQKE